MDPRAVGLALAGTLAVYNIDRLRDLERDHATAPLRTAFVMRHTIALTRCTTAALRLALLLVASAGVRVASCCCPRWCSGSRIGA